MGVIRNCETEEFVLLNVQHEVGRNLSIVNTCIAENDISKSHATLFWKNGGWNLQDHSRNGTLVNHNFIHHATIALKKGQIIQFGASPASKYQLVDESPPTSYLKASSGNKKVCALASREGIPFPDLPGVSFYFTPAHSWRAEVQGTPVDLRHGTALETTNERWIFHENSVLDETVDNGAMVASAWFRFMLSPDEERVMVQIVGKGLELDLGERNHHYLMLALARQRLCDLDSGLTNGDLGWMDISDLAHDLSREFLRDVDEYQINLQIHRIRKQMIELQPFGYLFSNIIERRKGELRFNHKYFQIVKEEVSQGEFLPGTYKTSFY
ncbi:MAG: FHA domain-containing protein [Bacteroidia bacterium]|nr:FHA domain-containing protein [Bacteroidia bacterium]